MHSWFALPLARAAFDDPSHQWIFYALLYVGGSFLIGSLMHRWIEGPMLRVRDRWVPRRAAAVATRR